MYRTNIYLDAEQVRALRHLAAEDMCSVAELVRRAVACLPYLFQDPGCVFSRISTSMRSCGLPDARSFWMRCARLSTGTSWSA